MENLELLLRNENLVHKDALWSLSVRNFLQGLDINLEELVVLSSGGQVLLLNPINVEKVLG